jgi:hypothetical protein
MCKALGSTAPKRRGQKKREMIRIPVFAELNGRVQYNSGCLDCCMM